MELIQADHAQCTFQMALGTQKAESRKGRGAEWRLGKWIDGRAHPDTLRWAAKPPSEDQLSTRHMTRRREWAMSSLRERQLEVSLLDLATRTSESFACATRLLYYR